MRKTNGGGVVDDLLAESTSPAARSGPASAEESQRGQGRRAARPGGRVRVVVGIEDEGFQYEVQDLVARNPRLEVVGVASDAARVAAVERKTGADVTVCCPLVAHGLEARSWGDAVPPLVVVAQQMRVPVLRDAIRAGARAVYTWPDERVDLVDGLVRLGAARRAEAVQAGRGRVIAVVGSRGGAGTTFVATHLASALHDAGRRAVLVDGDAWHADVTAALGILADESVRTIEDLLPVMSELDPDHVEDALYRHDSGLPVLLGPRRPPGETLELGPPIVTHEPDARRSFVQRDLDRDSTRHPGVVHDEGPAVPVGLYRGVVALLACVYEDVVVALGRAGGATGAEVARIADVALLVTTLDVFSLYGARRAMPALHVGEGDERCLVVVNRAGSTPVRPRDVQHVLQRAPIATIRSDPRVPRVQSRGELLPPTSRGAARDVRRLARLLSPPAARPGARD